MIKLTDVMSENWIQESKDSIDIDNSNKKLSETQLDEGVFKIGYKHIIPLIPTGYAPNDPKYKADLRYLRNMLNNFYKERGYDKVILPTF